MKFVNRSQDPWHTVVGDDGPMVSITRTPHRLLTLLQWRSVRSLWPDGMAVGVSLDNDRAVEDLQADLPRLALITLAFPKWTDGRAYSQARLLRQRYRFEGELRAVGEVLVDMLPLLARTGFNSVLLRADQSRDAAERALAFLPGHYQGGSRLGAMPEHRPRFALSEAERLAQAQPVPEPDFTQQGASI